MALDTQLNYLARYLRRFGGPLKDKTRMNLYPVNDACHASFEHIHAINVPFNSVWRV